GLTADQVAGSRSWYDPHWHYDNEPETRAALDLISSDYFSRYEPGVFAPLRNALLRDGDHYMHLADLKSYLAADQRLCELYADGDGWARKAILNVAGCGTFSSDRPSHLRLPARPGHRWPALHGQGYPCGFRAGPAHRAGSSGGKWGTDDHPAG